ncbi:MAG TPA: GGDEF domain-containing protein [Polyangiales bacterium]|nr:GGDEF domain-containing protein [Polyangiales bacterium]
MTELSTTQVTHIDPERQSQAGRTGTLTVLQGNDVGACFMLPKEANVLGRDPAVEVTLEDDSVSRNHARILVRGDGLYEIEDLGSTNGTYVAGALVSGKVRLMDGVRVQVGHTLLRFALQDEVERAAARRIYEMSVRDGLTGVYNRRYFEERLASEFAFAARHVTPLCIILADIDHFKRINDSWGHHAGDAVLRRVAVELQAGVRTEDVVARFGGEEFAIVARGIDVDGARMFAERVRVIIQRSVITWEGDRMPVTMSLGVAHNLGNASIDKPELLVAAADMALYSAKHNGRNRVEVAGKNSSQAPSDPNAKPRKRTWEKPTAPADFSHQQAFMPQAGKKPSPR